MVRRLAYTTQCHVHQTEEPSVEETYRVLETRDCSSEFSHFLLHHRRKIISGKLRTSTQVCEPSTHLAKLNATVTFDFQQNLPLPHISVGDVFYVHQLWLYVFGVHECGFNRAVMYSWPEFIAGKGGNEVVSCLDNCLPEEVTGTGKLARHRPYGKRCPLRPFTRIPCLWQTAVRQL